MFRQLDFRSWFTFLSRNRLYTAVNFIGLALALAFVLLVADYTVRQLTVDNYHTKADRIYAVCSEESVASGYYLHLELGQPTDAVIIPRGSFYQSTGGAWIYVLAPEGDRAYKRQIRIGRQNPQYYEVLEGLEPGERVIVSGYENYGANDVLILNK